jgi:uncharacterized protein (TIGR00369 family)
MLRFCSKKFNKTIPQTRRPGDVKQGISEERKRFLERDFRQGFIAYCQLEGEVIRRGNFQSRVRIEEHHRQQDGFIHAGVMATMADHTAGYAAFTTVDEVYQILTIEFKINFLKPASGDCLVCRSKVIREGSQIIIAESEVFDRRKGQEVLVAKAIVTLMAVPREKISPAPRNGIPPGTGLPT